MAEVQRKKRKRLPSGYDEDFVNAVEEDFQCLICHLPLKEPVQTRCGHRFCKECLEEHFTRQGLQNQPITCPADREALDQDRDVFPDKATERKILSLAIKCPNKGCGWTGELSNKKAHLASCVFKLVSCTNKNCHMTVQRKNLKEHAAITCQWRILECDHCSEPHPECQMKDHTAECNKFPVSCPNSCGRSFPRETIPNHTKDDCPLTIVSCPYVEMGCETKVQRKQMESHLQSAVRLHLDLACLKLNGTQKKLETTTKLVKKFNTRMFIWKIDNFSEILRQAYTGEKNTIESAPFYTDRTESYGYKLNVKLYPNGEGSGENTHLSVYIVVMKGEHDAILPWPFKKKVKLTLIDQQENPVKRKNITDQFIPDDDPECFARPTQEQSSTGYGFHEFITPEKLYSRRYLVDDTLFLQVEVGP
ncbi:hypothetical protein ACROYT_G042239 [Oculina patagonica]